MLTYAGFRCRYNATGSVWNVIMLFPFIGKDWTNYEENRRNDCPGVCKTLHWRNWLSYYRQSPRWKYDSNGTDVCSIERRFITSCQEKLWYGGLLIEKTCKTLMCDLCLHGNASISGWTERRKKHKNSTINVRHPSKLYKMMKIRTSAELISKPTLVWSAKLKDRHNIPKQYIRKYDSLTIIVAQVMIIYNHMVPKSPLRTIDRQ